MAPILGPVDRNPPPRHRWIGDDERLVDPRNYVSFTSTEQVRGTFSGHGDVLRSVAGACAVCSVETPRNARFCPVCGRRVVRERAAQRTSMARPSWIERISRADVVAVLWAVLLAVAFVLVWRWLA